MRARGIKIIGLTGSIGMGKSEAARMLKNLGIPVFEADAAVHKLLGKNGAAVTLIEKAFPDCVQNEIVDRQALGRKIFGQVDLKKQLEAILHPLVREAENCFIKHARQQRKKLVVLDIPLLFETGGEQRSDVVMVVSAPALVQRGRVLKREGMTEQKFHDILKLQMPDSEKRRRAEVVIHTGLGKRFTLCEIVHLLYETNRTRYRNDRT